MRKERRSGGSHIEAYLFFNSLTAYIKLQSHIRRSRSEAPAVSRERGLPNTSSFAPPTRHIFFCRSVLMHRASYYVFFRVVLSRTTELPC